MSKMAKWIVVISIVLFQQHTSFGQSNYFQENSTDLSEHFLYSDDLVAKTISDRNGQLTRSRGFEIRKVTENGSLFTRNLHSSGKVFFNCGANDYLNELKSMLLADYPHINDLVKVYTTKNSSLNAFATVNNNIYVNVGLLAKVETEAQLAYILSHEIMHIVNQHIIAQSLIIKDKKESYNQKDVLLAGEILALYRHSVSRDHETEADVDGMTLFLKQSYNPFEAVNALKMLASTKSVTNLLTFTENSLFTDSLSFARMNDYLLSTATDSTHKKKTLDTRYLTHPLIANRIKKVQELLSTKDNSGATFLLSESRFNDIKTQSNALLQSIYAEDFDFFELFKSSVSNYHLNSDHSDENLNYLCYSLQGLFVQKQNKDLDGILHLELDNIIDSALITFLKESNSVECSRWIYQALNTLNETHFSNITQRYLLDMRKNILLMHGDNLAEICDDCTDFNSSDSTFFAPDISLYQVRFNVDTYINLTARQLINFNNRGTSQYSSGKVAITSTSNVKLEYSSVRRDLSHYPLIDEKLDKMTDKVWRNLEEDYPENIVSVVPNDQSYTKEQYENLITLSNWLEARLYFDGFNYQYIDHTKIDDLQKQQDISYTFATLNLELKGTNAMRALLLILGMIPAPIYIPQLTANLFLMNTRKYQLSLFFDLQSGNLAYWDARTYLNPSSTAMFHQNYNDVITNFIGK